MTKIVNLLRVEAFSAAEITEKLKIETKLVAASLTTLVRQKEIQRVSESNKKWCLIKSNPVKALEVKAPEVKKTTVNVMTKEIAMTKIVNLLRVEAFSAAEITEKLKIEKELVAGSLSELFQQKKIQRVSEDKNKWYLIKLTPVKAPEVKKTTGSVVTKEIAMTKVLNLLQDGAFSAAEITEQLGIQKELVALSLSQLRFQKKIQHVFEGNNFKWCLISLIKPTPVKALKVKNITESVDTKILNLLQVEALSADEITEELKIETKLVAVSLTKLFRLKEIQRVCQSNNLWTLAT
jgi:transcriptional regulator with AAA-type ATPase domain